jgi:hypothetical protein
VGKTFKLELKNRLSVLTITNQRKKNKYKKMYLVLNGVLITKPEVGCDMLNSFFLCKGASATQ